MKGPREVFSISFWGLLAQSFSDFLKGVPTESPDPCQNRLQQTSSKAWLFLPCPRSCIVCESPLAPLMTWSGTKQTILPFFWGVTYQKTHLSRYGGFLKWWYPTTMVFLLKMNILGYLIWGYHHLRKHPYGFNKYGTFFKTKENHTEGLCWKKAKIHLGP